MTVSGSESLKHPARERWYYETLRRLRWPGGVSCPHCKSAYVSIHSRLRATPCRKYRCRACERIFTDLTGTPLSGTNLPLSAWCLYLRLMEYGYTTSELAKELGVKWDTAASLQRRVALALHPSGLMQQLRRAIQKDATASTDEPR